MKHNIGTNNADNIISGMNLKVSEYLSVKKEVFNDDYIEFLGDGASIVKGLTSIAGLVKKKRLAYFLKGLSMDKEPSFEQLCRMSDYIDDEEKAEFISDVIDKILNANSKLASYLVGILVCRIINSEEAISHEALTYVNAMSHLFDDDIRNFEILHRYLSSKALSDELKIDIDEFVDWCRRSNIDVESSIELTIEKAMSNQLFTKSVESFLHTDERSHHDMNLNQSNVFLVTTAGNILFQYIIYLDVL